MINQTYMTKFEEHLKILNRSERTIESYLYNVKDFFRVIGDMDVKKITGKTIEDYVQGLYQYLRPDNNEPYKASTIGIKIRSIKRFFEYLEQSNAIFMNPATFIREPVPERKVFNKVLSSEEVRLILEQPKLNTRIGVRDRAILEVFYATGIRRRELCNLTIHDPDLKENMLRINQGKGRKDRLVPMGKHATVFLSRYLTGVRPRLIRPNPEMTYLFVNVHGRSLSYSLVESVVKKYAQQAGIKRVVSPHSFRHTFASVLAKNEADMVAIQKMLGHACLSSTQVYLKSLGFDLKKFHAKTHPREFDPPCDATPRIERRTNRRGQPD